MTKQETLTGFTEAPLVSIVLCSFNGELYLREQLDSILEQTYPNFELVISDDASTDSTPGILEEYQRKDRRLRYTVNPVNIGYNKNFEKVIGEATGEYIATSDQDDVWEKDKIRLMMDQWPPGAEFVYSLSGSFTERDFAGRKPAPNVLYGPISDLHQLVFNSPVHGHACLFKKELVARCLPFSPDVFYDWWMSMHAAASGTIGSVPQTLTWHRVHGSNFSRDLMSIADEKERDVQLRRQCAYFIESFFEQCNHQREERSSLLHYAALLKTMDGKKFSGSMFRFVMRHRNAIFHYKRPRPFIWFSHLKHAFRMGYRGLL